MNHRTIQLPVHAARACARAAMAVGAIAAAVGPLGCAKPLFPENAPRTQFEKFDSMRSGAAPAEEPDIFGRPQPALRARLTPKTND
ncbi:MAG: hypothetical protein ACKOV8_09240 [Phycisphaerales bacterium]